MWKRNSFSGVLCPLVPGIFSLPAGTPCQDGSFLVSFQVDPASLPSLPPAPPLADEACGSAACCWGLSASLSWPKSGSWRSSSY
eukprot:15554381-Heterocapsa_arctica.AAC.1